IIENHNQYNFALDVAGAQVIYQMTSSTQGLTLWCRMKRWWTGGEASCDHEFVLPTEVIRAGDAMEGECWTFEGGSGHITIRLSETVKISSLTIQQVKPFAPQGSSQAPRGIALWGLVSQAPTDIFTLLAQLEYDDSESTSSIQMFPIQHPDFLAGFRVVILDVTSNWGSNLTCISRVKIHGIPV
ncbi:UNC-like C-terminal-domain-containing protein, partial [Mycena latifolia]